MEFEGKISQLNILNSDLLRDTIEFAENIEFSDNFKPKIEIEDEKESKIENQEFGKSTQFYVKPKLEPKESSERPLNVLYVTTSLIARVI